MSKTEQRLATLEAEVAELRKAAAFLSAIARTPAPVPYPPREDQDRIVAAALAEYLRNNPGLEAREKPSRPRHLMAVRGGQQ